MPVTRERLTIEPDPTISVTSKVWQVPQYEVWHVYSFTFAINGSPTICGATASCGSAQDVDSFLSRGDHYSLLRDGLVLGTDVGPHRVVVNDTRWIALPGETIGLAAVFLVPGVNTAAVALELLKVPGTTPLTQWG